MYSDVMQRTQIYLDEADVAQLDQAAARTGASRSELIRRAIRDRYGSDGREAKLAALQASAGAWRDWKGSGEEYVDAIRGDLNERLERGGHEARGHERRG